jgi:hypothetical protein
MELNLIMLLAGNLNGAFNMRVVRWAVGILCAVGPALVVAAGAGAIVEEAAAASPELPPALRAVGPLPRLAMRPSWKLLQASAGEQGRSAVSITKIADTENSDMDLIGVVIRCSPPARVDVAFVVADPFPPRSQPTISIDSPRGAVAYQGEVAPGGTAVVLPEAAAGLAAGLWQEFDQLAVRITDKGRQTVGRIDLDGLRSAYGEMMAKCMP